MFDICPILQIIPYNICSKRLFLIAIKSSKDDNNLYANDSSEKKFLNIIYNNIIKILCCLYSTIYVVVK
jgi:hypothetical protein